MVRKGGQDSDDEHFLPPRSGAELGKGGHNIYSRSFAKKVDLPKILVFSELMEHSLSWLPRRYGPVS